VRTAAGVERLLARQQQKPVPFFGTVLADEVDVAAVDAAWGKRAAQPEATDPAADELRDLPAEAAGLAGTAPAATRVAVTAMTRAKITNINPIQQSATPDPATRHPDPVRPQPSGPGVATSPEAAPMRPCVIAPLMRDDAGQHRGQRKIGVPA
jgi:hypothetical protein